MAGGSCRIDPAVLACTILPCETEPGFRTLMTHTQHSLPSLIGSFKPFYKCFLSMHWHIDMLCIFQACILQDLPVLYILPDEDIAHQDYALLQVSDVGIVIRVLVSTNRGSLCCQKTGIK